MQVARGFDNLTGRSTAMQEVFGLLVRLAHSSVTVTILGETGTGKDVLAHAIHRNSPRCDAPSVVFDCGAVAANLAESELFGHERGAFTGAVAAHAGAFERAHGGTLFLDEIGELPMDLQPRLLRALECRQIRRVGGGQCRDVDVRVLAATNRDLQREVAAGSFRQDLYFRLAGAFVRVPSLRERLEDLEFLVPQVLADLGAPGVEVSPEVYAVMRQHTWPGNVRELKNALACALVFCTNDLIEEKDLHVISSSSTSDVLSRLPLSGHPLHRIEKAAITQTLALVGGNKAKAAELLEIALSTLYDKARKFGIC